MESNRPKCGAENDKDKSEPEKTFFLYCYYCDEIRTIPLSATNCPGFGESILLHGAVFADVEDAVLSRKENLANKQDPVNSPSHYKDTVPGIECIDVTKHFSFCRGNAIKYLWRAGSKDDTIQDLKKAIWYINKEIEDLEK